MKIFKKALSLLLTAAIMVGMMCVGTVSVGAAELKKPVVSISENNGLTYLVFQIPSADLLGIFTESLKKEKTTFSIRMRISEYEFIFDAYKDYYDYQIIKPDGYSVSLNDYSSALNSVGWQLSFDSNSEVAKVLNSASSISYNYYIRTQSGNYLYGDKSTHYKYIIKKDNSISSFSFSKLPNYTYTGKAIKPAVTVKDGDKKLVKGTDYTVSYKNNTKIGTASVTIKGKGSYTGEKTLTFKIVPAKTTLKVSKKSDTKATFSWTAVKGAEKYQLYYSVDGGKTYKKYTTISGSKTSYTASKLDFKKYDYKFKLRAYDKVGKTTYYGSYSKIVSVK